MEYEIVKADFNNKKEVNDIKNLIKDAFDRYNKNTNKKEDVPLRTDENIIELIKECRDGSILLKIEDKIKGAIFCHRLGEIGWFGPLAISSDMYGKGYGKILVSCAKEYYRDLGINKIILETMVDAIGNVSFYSKLGYEIEVPKVYLMKVLREKNTTNYSCFDFKYDGKQNLYDEVSEFLGNGSVKIEDLDAYISKENSNVFIVRENESCKISAVGVYNNEKSNEKIEKATFMIKYLFYKDENELSGIIKSIENYSRSKLKVILTMGIQGKNGTTINKLIADGYKATKLSQVMEQELGNEKENLSFDESSIKIICSMLG